MRLRERASTESGAAAANTGARDAGGLEQVHRLTSGEVFRALSSGPAGITPEEVARRLERFGPNRLPELRKPSPIVRFLAQFADFFAILLEIAAGITFGSWMIRKDPGDLHISLAIVGVVVLNALIGFIQEYRAERTAQALRRMLPAKARVLRGGKPAEILADRLVPGDVLMLDEGAHVSADAFLFEAFELSTNDAALTGESEAVRRQATPVLEDVPLVQAKNLVYSGTSVVTGAGRAVVYATGEATQFGKIYRMTAGLPDPPSPLQLEIASAARRVAVVALSLGGLLLALRLAMHASFVEGFLYALGVMVALVPEGLPATMSVSLAVAVGRMAKARALVKRLVSVETLGSTTVICTDKTGTLTAGQMTVRSLWCAHHELEVTGVGYSPEGRVVGPGGGAVPAAARDALGALVRTAMFCNDARLLHDGGDGWSPLGDPTEAALLVLAAKAGYDVDEQARASPRVREIPFESQRKRMTVVVQHGPHRTAYVKGAPGEILARSTRVLDAGGERELSDRDRAGIEAAVDRMAVQGLRVLAFASRPVRPGDALAGDALERDLVFAGLAGMQDPPRPEVIDAVRCARRAGIRIVMMTGDHGLTAEAIARKIRIVTTDDPLVLTGVDLDRMSRAELEATLAAASSSGREIVFARVAPSHKLEIVSAFDALGEIVAATGDGVNDAPALKRADIGIAMGIAGTDVAKEAAVMILLDDSFATIVTAIERGRAVFKNIRRFLVYLFSHNIGELCPILVATFVGLPVVPLNALQVLAIDLGSDVLPALALGTERPERGLLEEPPRPRSERLMSAAVFRRFLFLGGFQAVGVTAAFFIVLYGGGWRFGSPLTEGMPLYHRAITMTQAGIVLSQCFNGLAVRTDRESILSAGVLSNPMLVAAELFGIAIMAAISYFPPFQAVFGTAPLSWQDWVIGAAFGLALLVAEETRKAVVRRRRARAGAERCA